MPTHAVEKPTPLPDGDPQKPTLFELLRRLNNDLHEWSTANRGHSRLLLVGLAGMMFVMLGLWTFLAKTVTDDAPVFTLDMALEALDAGKFSEAKRLIRRLQDQGRLSPADYGGPMFVLGSIHAHEADPEIVLSSERRQAMNLIASRYFEEARNRGFPAARNADGYFLLFRTLVMSGQYAGANELINETLELNPHRQASIHMLAAKLKTHLADPQLEVALAHIDDFLAAPALSPSEQADGLVTKIDILLRQQQTVAARAAMDQLSEFPVEAGTLAMLEGRWKLAEAMRLQNDVSSAENEQAATQLLEEAIKTFRETAADVALGGDHIREAMYLIGLAYQQMGRGQYPAAVRQLQRTRKLYPNSPEGIASSLAEADIFLAMEDYRGAIEAYRRTLSASPHPSLYENRWLPLSELRRRILLVYHRLIDAGQFEASLLLVDGFQPLFDEVQATQVRGEILGSWGKALLAEAANEYGQKRVALEKEGRLKHRQSGQLYEQLANLRFATRHYPEDLYQSAHGYGVGHCFSREAEVLQLYLDNEVVGKRPQALARLGAAQLAMGKFEEAIETLQESINFFPHDASIYQARLSSAKANREIGQIERARELLEQNLIGDTLTPKSIEWRDSLFLLGFILNEQGKYEETIDRLEQATARYPDAPQAVLAEYVMAVAYRNAAKQPLLLAKDGATANERHLNRLLAAEYLTASLSHFESVQRSLTIASEDVDLERLDKALLRNCYLMRGGILFEMKRYDEALTLFRNASSVYQHDPVVLVAYAQIANCHHRLGQSIEARGTLEQAKVIIDNLPADADYLVATNFSRDQWLELLDDMSQW